MGSVVSVLVVFKVTVSYGGFGAGTSSSREVCKVLLPVADLGIRFWRIPLPQDQFFFNLKGIFKQIQGALRREILDSLLRSTN